MKYEIYLKTHEMNIISKLLSTIKDLKRQIRSYQEIAFEKDNLLAQMVSLEEKIQSMEDAIDDEAVELAELFDWHNLTYHQREQVKELARNIRYGAMA